MKSRSKVIAFEHGISQNIQISTCLGLNQLSCSCNRRSKPLLFSTNLVINTADEWMMEHSEHSNLMQNVIKFVFPVACISRRNNLPLIKWFFRDRHTTNAQQRQRQLSQIVTFSFSLAFSQSTNLLQSKNA